MAITNGYATKEQFQTRCGLTSIQLTNKTSLIEEEIERNSRTIDKITGNLFYEKTLTASKVIYNFGLNSDKLRMSEDRTRIYFPGKILTLTSITTSDDTLVADDDYYQGYDFIEASGTFPSDREDAVKITGTCGETTTPYDITKICLAMTEVTTGLGTYTVTDAGGDSTQITRDNMPDWVAEELYIYSRVDNYG